LETPWALWQRGAPEARKSMEATTEIEVARVEVAAKGAAATAKATNGCDGEGSLSTAIGIDDGSDVKAATT